MRKVELGAYVATILMLFVGLAQLVLQVRIQRGVGRVEQQALTTQFRVVYPASGSTVGLTTAVRGSTPYDDRKHFLVVTPMDTGDNWVQEEPVTVRPDGSWSGQARFGTANAGVGQDFMIRAVATRSFLSSGVLVEVPSDAVFSVSATVTRSR